MQPLAATRAPAMGDAAEIMADALPSHVELPGRCESPFWHPHVTYFQETLKALGVRVDYAEDLKTLNELCFPVRIDGVAGLLDIRDGTELLLEYANYAYIIRYTYTQAMAPSHPLLPFPGISFHDWEQYARLLSEIQYAGCGDRILANFNPRIGELNRDLTVRRLYVQGLLRHAYGSLADFELTDQDAYWRKMSDCLVAVHVPGFSNNRLDRSQHQMFGLGCCTISPVLQTYVLTGPPVPWEHYVPCRDDYEDLIAKIEWCRENREACVRIGRRAEAFFRSQSTPVAIWSHICARLRGAFP